MLRVIVAFVTIFVVFHICLLLITKYTNYLALKEKVRSLGQEMALLQQENLRLKNEITELHSPSRIEEVARERLGLTKPNEIAFRVANPSISNSHTSIPGYLNIAGISNSSNIHKENEKIVINEGTLKKYKEQDVTPWWENLWKHIRHKLQVLFGEIN